MQSDGEVGFSCEQGLMFFNKPILRIVHPIYCLIELIFNISDLFFQVKNVVVAEVELGLDLIQLEAAKGELGLGFSQFAFKGGGQRKPNSKLQLLTHQKR